MSGYWCWERDDWGRWSMATLKGHDSYHGALKAMMKIRTITSQLTPEDRAEAEASLLEEESIKTSLIEGKTLNRESVRASINKKLGIGAISNIQTRDVDGLIETLSDAVNNFRTPLTHERLFRWQASLFPTGRDERGFPLEVGQYRSAADPMRVVTISGRKEKVHFVAPPSDVLQKEMEQFITWFNKTSSKPTLIRAAIASYWFVSIHPFEDGNGRICRVIADMAIAQAETSPYRLYSMSEALKSNKSLIDGYYENLEKCQRGEIPIDNWVVFFLEALTESLKRSEVVLDDILVKTRFWDLCRHIAMNDRQKDFMNWILDKGNFFEGHIKRQRYKNIVGGISEATAKRDLLDLAEKGVISPIEKIGRNAGYEISPDKIAKAEKSSIDDHGFGM
jgi:Fic family protein